MSRTVTPLNLSKRLVAREKSSALIHPVSGYLQQVSVHQLGGSHTRGLVELWFKQYGNVLSGGRLLIGQAGLRLSQVGALHARITVQGRP